MLLPCIRPDLPMLWHLWEQPLPCSMEFFLKRYTEEVLLAYDSDEAGVKAILRALPILRSAGLRIRVIHMDPYKDPDEFIKNLGVDAFKERIEQAENSFMFEVSVLEKSYDLGIRMEKPVSLMRWQKRC